MLRDRDPRGLLGPVRSARLKPGRFAKVVAKGAGIDFRLDEPSQGSLGATLRSGDRHYCTLFGGTVRRDQPGVFIAVRAPAPVVCPG
jgi:hypothetical protein